MKKIHATSCLIIFIAAFALANPPQKQNSPKVATKKTVSTKSIKKTNNPTELHVGKDALEYGKFGATEEITGNGNDMMISGNSNKLTITGSVGKIVISGKDNDITLVSVNEIKVTGTGNFISWEKSTNSNGKPIVQKIGGYNNIEKR